MFFFLLLTPKCFTEKLKEEVQTAEETHAKQANHLKDLQDEKKRHYTEADEYSKQIVEYATDMADLEKRSKGPLKPSKIRTSVRKRWRQQKKHKSEVETANSRVGRLKQMHLNNLTIKQNRNAEIQDLRKQLQALEEKMSQLGIEKDKDEDKKELAEAIAMSETALLIADTHALARVDKRLRVYIHYLRKHIVAAFQRNRNPCSRF